ncbi:MAG: hypothetical protein ABR929_15280, partial [Roseiarcus sp.]
MTELKRQRIRDPVHDLIEFDEGDGFESMLWRVIRSCPVGWCSSGSVGAALAGTSRAGQAATAGSPTMGSS